VSVVPVKKAAARAQEFHLCRTIVRVPWRQQADGRVFWYFDGYDAVIVWKHERRDQPIHLDILVTAREGGSDHAGLTRWWRRWHHVIGKAG